MPTVPALPRGPFHGLVRAGVCAFFPACEGLPGLDALDVDAFLVQLWADTTAMVWWGLVGSALAFQLSPIWTLGIPLPAAWLSPRARDRHADRASATTFYALRQAAFLLKTFGGMAWAGDPDVRRRLGQAPLPPEPDTWRTA